MRVRRLFPTRPDRSRMLNVSAVAVAILTLAVAAWAQAPHPGLANGFEVDGNLFSNNPVTGAPGSDWLDGPPGPGESVLFASGVPKNPLATWHFIDMIKSADQDIFSESSKVYGDPNTYEWKPGSVPQKDDVQNGLVRLSTDAAGNYWMIVAGDRRAITGNSYIDFEFLQKPLDMKSDGSFESAGPHGGRTLGDILLTIELLKGGAQAQFFAQEWASDGAGGYTYVDIPFPSGAAFVAANVDSQVTTSYSVFDGYEYGVNQYGEAAVNLNALLPDFGECFAIATVFVRTKSSASASADLKDFIAPFQLNQCLDKVAPQVTCPADIVVPCTQSTDPRDLGFAFANDNCDRDPQVAYVDSVVTGPCADSRTILRKWKAVDQCGNTTICMQTITVVDDTPPVIFGGPGPLTVQCDSEIPAPDTESIRASDDCRTPLVTYLGDVSDGKTCPQIITRTYRVDDGCGNTVNFVQLITIDDQTPPRITAPQNVAVQCADNVPEPDIRLVSASDNCGGVTVSFVGDVSDGKTCPQIITRTYRATDACGNVSEAVQLITVDDTTPPQVSGPQDIAVECDGEVPPPNVELISANDNCGGVTVSVVGDVSDGKTCPARITRTYRAVDACGNATDYRQFITVGDKTAPEVAGPADVTVECRGEIPPADTRTVTATDNCGPVAVTHAGDASNGLKCPETITRTYRATDACGNYAEWVQIITVDDRTDPRITPPRDITVACIDLVPPAAPSAVTATDNCGSVSVIHVGDYSDGHICPETISRVFRATDACGNTAECTQKITVSDVKPPVITSGPGPLRVQCSDDIPVPSIALITAHDECGEVTVSHLGDASDNKTCPETVLRTYRVYDTCRNYSDFVQTITVDDDIPPRITSCPAKQMIECPDVLDFGYPTATDNCDPHPDLTVVDEDSTLGSEPWTFTATRTWTATDDCGNASEQCTQKIMFACEADGLCTHTQGFWGNYGGKFNGMTTLELIQAALSSSPLVVGTEARSLTIPYVSAHCVIERLPAGTTPTILPYNGNSTLWASTCLAKPKAIPLDSNGKFENVFLGQTITLGLNMRLSPALFLFPLSEEFCTQPALPGPDGLLGTEDDVLNTSAPIGHYHISRSVLDAISRLGLWPTVKGLWDLANRGLAGANTGGASLPAINDAVDAINRGFDGYRFIVDCTATKQITQPNPFASSGLAAAPETGSAIDLPKAFELGQNHPNPFNPTTTITIAVPRSVRWTLAVYSVTGQLVRRFEGSTGGPEFLSVEWDGTDLRGQSVATGVYFYRLQAGTYTSVKKMVLLE